MILRKFISIVALLTTSLSTYAADDCAKRLTIASWNLENAFDTVRDRGKNDTEFLPNEFRDQPPATLMTAELFRKQVDWTHEGFALKMDQIAKVVLPGSDVSLPQKPSILGVVELENANVAHRVGMRLQYDGIDLTNSPDARGIDVGVLYQDIPGLQLIQREEHVLSGPEFKGHPTRNILELVFRVNKKYDLHVFVNHWPSQLAPTSAPRVAAAKALKALMLSREEKNPEARVISMGDFNTIDADSPNPFTDELLSPVQGTQRIFDVEQVYRNRERGTITIPNGTYNYKGTWNSLDRFFVNEKLLGNVGLVLDVLSFRIHAPRGLSVQANGTLVPHRYNHAERNPDRVGFSDHYAIYVDLEVKD